MAKCPDDLKRVSVIEAKEAFEACQGKIQKPMTLGDIVKHILGGEGCAECQNHIRQSRKR